LNHPAATLVTELDSSSSEREQRVVVSATDVRPRVEVGAALTDDDFSGLDNLATETLHAQVLGV
jgi:hypothetical protein